MKKTVFLATLALTLCGIFGLARSQNQEPPQQSSARSGWKAGVASEKITPDTSMWMAGFASRKAPSEGVETDLHAKALLLEDTHGTRLAFVTLDLIGIPRELRASVAQRLEAEHNLPPAALVLNASHTHCGPELRAQRTGRSDDTEKRAAEAEAYQAKVGDAIVRIVGKAISQLAPVEADYSQGRCGFAMNRRTPTATGFKNFPNPDGPVDHRVPVLSLRPAGEKNHLAVLFGYACHCTTLSGQKLNADYAGYAQQDIEATYPGATALFLNGCSGDQNPYPRGKVELAEAHGRTLSLAVQAALGTEMKPVSGDLRAAFREIPLAYDVHPTREELETMAQSSTALDANLAKNLLGRLDNGETLPRDYPYPVQVFRLGDQITLVALGGEVVVDYSLRLQKDLTDPIVWVAGYSNDVMTYIPSKRVLDEGGYEGDDARKWGFHPARWSPRVEEHIVETVQELRQELD